MLVRLLLASVVALAVPAHAQTLAGDDAVVWAYDSGTSDPAARRFRSFPLATPGDASDGPQVLAPGSTLVQGCDFDEDGQASTVLCMSFRGELFSVDLATGETTSIGVGSYAGVVTDITYRAANDTWYAISSTCAQAEEDHATVVSRFDPATGVATALDAGPTASYCGIALAAAPDGALYAYNVETSAAPSTTVRVNPTRGDVVPLGPTGQAFRNAQAMDCDRGTGACYAFGTLGTGDTGLYQLDPATGAFALVEAFPQGRRYSAAALVPRPPVAAEADPLAAFALRVVENPARGVLRLGVTAGVAGRLTLSVFDALGRQVAERDLGEVPGERVLTLDVAEWAAGVYTVRVAGAGETLAETVTVVR